MEKRMNKQELMELIESLKLDKNEYWILSSGSLVIRNIYPDAGDLDIAVTEKGLQELKNNYKLQEKGNGWYKVSDKIECVVDTKESWKIERYDGLNLQSIEMYYEFLKNSNREKDKARIPLIEEYMEKNKTKKIDMGNLKENIEKFIPYNEQEEVDRNIMLKYINDFDDVLTRQNEYGHFTSSAFVINKERTKILMIYHKIYNSWAWTGGHSDGDSDLLYVAMKEAKEETGIKNVTPISKDIYSLELINVNGHEKRGKYVGSHVHINVTYLLEADENEEIHIKEDENSGVKWVPINEVLEMSSEPWIRDRVYAKIIDKMKKDKIIKANL